MDGRRSAHGRRSSRLQATFGHTVKNELEKSVKTVLLEGKAAIFFRGARAPHPTLNEHPRQRLHLAALQGLSRGEKTTLTLSVIRSWVHVLLCRALSCRASEITDLSVSRSSPESRGASALRRETRRRARTPASEMSDVRSAREPETRCDGRCARNARDRRAVHPVHLPCDLTTAYKSPSCRGSPIIRSPGLVRRPVSDVADGTGRAPPNGPVHGLSRQLCLLPTTPPHILVSRPALLAFLFCRQDVDVDWRAWHAGVARSGLKVASRAQ